MSDSSSSNSFLSTLYLIFSVCTSMIGYKIHNSFWWAIFDFMFTPIVWVKWLFCHDVTLKIIKNTFSWFLN